MARIRSIKPAFCESEAIAALSVGCQLHFVKLWTYADDEGRGRDNARLIKGVLWPLCDEVDVHQVEDWQAELARAGRIERYEVDDRRYFQVANWAEHQKPQHPRPSECPPPPRNTAQNGNSPPPAPEQAHEDDRKPHEASPESAPVVVVGEVVEEGEGEEPPPPPTKRSTALAIVGNGVSATPTANGRASPVQQVFDAWIDSTGRTNKTHLDGKRRRRIESALKAYPLEDVLDAVRGWQYSPHHRGENDRATVYNDLELLLRDAAHLEQFRDLARNERRPGPRRAPGVQMLADRVAARRAQA